MKTKNCMKKKILINSTHNSLDLIRRDLESTKVTKSDEYFDFILLV